MCKDLFKLLVSCQILLLVIPNVSPFNPNTPEFVANRRKMLDLVLNDKCNELNHLSRTFETAHIGHKFINPRKYRRAKSKLREWNSALSVGDEACKEALNLWTKLPGDEMAKCPGAILPMCREYLDTGWVCSVLWHNADLYDPPLEFTFKDCIQKSLEVDEAYRKEWGPEVGASRSPGHKRRYSPGRDSKNSDTSSRNSKRNRKNAEATDKNALNRHLRRRSSDGEDKPPDKNYSLITQYGDSNSSSQRSKSSNGRESQRSRSRKRENFEEETRAVAVAAAAVAANEALDNARAKKEKKADKMKSQQKMVQDWMDSNGEKSWGTGGNDVLKTGSSHQDDVKSPVRDSPRVKKRGRANSPSSPNRAFKGDALNVKLNRYYPGDVAIQP